MIIDHHVNKQIKKIGLSSESYFSENHLLQRMFLELNGEEELSFAKESKDILTAFEVIANKAASIDPTMKSSILAEASKQVKVVDQIEKKITKRLKEKNQVQLRKITKMQDKLFPADSLQERKSNIVELLSIYGSGLIKKISPHFDPFKKEFIKITLDPTDLDH